jgi:WD40 repeat protein
MPVENRQMAVWFDQQGKRLGEAGAADGYSGMDLSPDGKRLAMIGPGAFWVHDLERGTKTRLAQQVRAAGSGIWSPDGMSLVFTAQDKNRVQHLYRADASNTQPESLLLDEPGLHWPNDWSRDGKYLLYGFDEGKTFRDLWALPMGEPGAKPFQYTHGASLIKQGQFSPDGRFVAYTSDESGRYEIYVQPFPDASKGKMGGLSDWRCGASMEPGWPRIIFLLRPEDDGGRCSSKWRVLRSQRAERAIFRAGAWGVQQR